MPWDQLERKADDQAAGVKVEEPLFAAMVDIVRQRREVVRSLFTRY
jgi:hypothetical protein